MQAITNANAFEHKATKISYPRASMARVAVLGTTCQLVHAYHEAAHLVPSLLFNISMTPFLLIKKKKVKWN